MKTSTCFCSALLISASALIAGCASNTQPDPTNDAQPASAQIYANPSTRPSFMGTDAPHGQYNNPLDRPDDSPE